MLSSWNLEGFHVVSAGQTFNSFLERDPIFVAHDPVTNLARFPLLLFMLFENEIFPDRSRAVLWTGKRKDVLPGRIRRIKLRRKCSHHFEFVEEIDHKSIDNVKLRKLFGKYAGLSNAVLLWIRCKEEEEKEVRNEQKDGSAKKKKGTNNKPFFAATPLECCLASSLVFLLAVKAVPS